MLGDGGFAELQEALDSLTGTQRKTIERKALRRVGKIVQKAVQEHAPIRPDLPSGTALPIGALKDDIEYRIHLATDPIDDNSIVTVTPGKKTAHAADWVENGHALVAGGYSKVDGKGGRRGPGKVIGHVQPHPFIRPAADSIEGEAVEAFQETLAEEIQKVME